MKCIKPITYTYKKEQSETTPGLMFGAACIYVPAIIVSLVIFKFIVGFPLFAPAFNLIGQAAVAWCDLMYCIFSDISPWLGEMFNSCATYTINFFF